MARNRHGPTLGRAGDRPFHNELAGLRQAYGVELVAHAELAEDAFEVLLDGPRSTTESPGDSSVRVPGGQQGEHTRLPFGESQVDDRALHAGELADRRDLSIETDDGPLDVTQRSLIHGDLIPANVVVDAGQIGGVLDFGFLTTVGDPRFDAAITASIFDMYGPQARASEAILSEVLLERFGHDRDSYGLYRAAYAIITISYFGQDGLDGHYAWCVRMLRRPDVIDALLG